MTASPRAAIRSVEASVDENLRSEDEQKLSKWERLCTSKEKNREKVLARLQKEHQKLIAAQQEGARRKALVIHRAGRPDPKHAAFIQRLVLERKEQQRRKTENLQKSLHKRASLANQVRKLGQEIKLLKYSSGAEGEDLGKQRTAKEEVGGRDSLWQKHLEQARKDKASNRQVEETMDRARWARRHGITETTPVFICSKAYPAVRDELKRRGWYENTDRASLFWDLCFVMKINKIPHRNSLHDTQIVNRFFRTGELCSKIGILNNLKNVKWHDEIDKDDFFPRSYSLSDVEGDLDAFIDDFKVTAAESLLRLAKETYERQGEVQAPALLLEIAMNVCRRFVRTANNDDLDVPVGDSPPICTHLEWFFISSFESLESNLKSPPESLWKRKCKSRGERGFRKEEKKSFREAELSGGVRPSRIPEATITAASQVLEQLSGVLGRQYKLNCTGKNVWIVKPAGKSRGRGIACFDNLEEILEYSRANSKESQWTVQKYMENSLIVHQRKFDIRQWVLVTNWEPLTAWFYEDCYLRFCVNEYNLEDLRDKFTHLANNSISKKSPKFNETPITGSMWKKDQFIDYLNQEGREGKKLWNEKIAPQMKSIVQASLNCVQDMIESRPHSFELYGFDFMLDEELNPWLIEINSSPSMEYSTPVTKELTKRALTELVACVLDVKFAPTKSIPKKLSKRKKLSRIGDWQLLTTSTIHARRSPEMLSSKDLSVEGSQVPVPLHKKKKQLRKARF